MEDTTNLQRRVLGGTLLRGYLTAVGLGVDDFDPVHQPIYAAMVAAAGDGKPLSTVTVWIYDPSLDPLSLCELVSEFAMDESAFGFLVEAYALELRLKVQHVRRGKAA